MRQSRFCPWSRRTALALGAMVLVGACGASDDDSGVPVTDPIAAADSATGTLSSSAVPSSAVPSSATPVASEADGKPTVVVPDEIPTDLIVTDLTAGDGPVAEVGDTVVVDYIGVRSEDGVEFDNSYDRGQPFSLVVGTGSVIEGWDAGLLGAQAGMRRQLDIPADLAYGDQGAGDVIRAGDALTFVVDVIAVEKRPEVTAPPMADPSDCPATDGSEPKQQEFAEMQPFCIDADQIYTADVVTNFGSFTIELDPSQAPQAVNNFVTLARYHYFDDTQCHRVITDFVVQCGDPDASGFGGPGYAIPDELPLPGQYEIGSIAMANSGPDSAGSQFFIISGPNGASLPPQYTLFGQVVDGYEPVITELNTLENPNGDNGVPPLETITIESVTITGP